MIKIIEFDFGTIKVYDHLLVSELKEGILFDMNSNRKLLDLGAEEFKGKPNKYISHRVNSYAVDPLVYRESAEYSSLKAIVVVTTNPIGIQSAEVERSFLNTNIILRFSPI